MFKIVLLALFTGKLLLAQVDVLTAQYDNSRTSSNTQETILTQSNVNSAQFGKLFSRTVDAPFYASPLVVSNLNIPSVGVRNVVFVGTLGNTIYAFDADDPNASAPYWSVNLGTPATRSSTFLGPTIGILSTPVINRSTNTIYVTAIVKDNDAGLYVYALDLTTGTFKFNSPRRISYNFSTGLVKTDAQLSSGDSWLQRAGLLLVNNILYVGTSNVWSGTSSTTQQGFIQAFQANDLNVQLASFETSPGSRGGFWQAGRGIAADASGNVFAAVNGGIYSPPLTFGDSIVKLASGSLTPMSWFTPLNWSLLHEENLDMSAGGVTLIPSTNLAFSAGKVGILYLVDQANLGGLEAASDGSPVQQFAASQGCGIDQCSQHLATAFWPHSTNPMLYVWDVYDSLRAYPFDLASQRFSVADAAVGGLLPSRAGGISVTSNGSRTSTAIVWAITATEDPLQEAVPGALRAYKADDITQEIYNSDQNSCRDGMGSFVKFSTPIVANGKVYVNTQSNSLPVYGLLPEPATTSPTSGSVHVTIRTSIEGLQVSVDGAPPCSGTRELYWTSGSSHTLSTVSPQAGNNGNTPQAGTPGMRYAFTGWSDGGAMSHNVATSADKIYTANFAAQYYLTTSVLPDGGGSITASPKSSSAYFDSGTSVQLTATPAAGCTFTKWTGAIIGSGSSQAVTMSAPRSVTANFTCVTPPTPMLTSYDLRILRNNFSGWVGTSFTTGPSAITVTALGRMAIAGNSGTHVVKVVKANGGTEVVGSAVAISMAGTAGGRVQYAILASPLVLSANTTYYLVSQEFDDGDKWYDVGLVTPSSAVTLNSAVYSSDGASWNALNSGNWSYGPPNLLYFMGGSIVPQAGLITGTSSNNPALRNDFTGWIGTQFTVGANLMTVSRLGRICVENNAGSHVVKLANANGTDVAGGSAILNMSECTPGQFIYASIGPVVLSAGASYILATQESAGGDRWYDQAVVPVNSAAASVTNAVYSYNGSNWNPINSTNASYGPPNLLYAVTSTPESPPPSPPPTTGTSFLTGYALTGGSLRNDFAGWVGMRLAIGSAPVTVSAVGRICVAGNSAVHTAKFANPLSGIDIPGGSAQVNMASCVAGQFVYASLASPITLTAGASYYLVSQEVQGGDRWYGQDGVSSTNAGSVLLAVYSYTGATWIDVAPSNTSYAPPNFLYSSDAGPAVPEPTQYTLNANVAPSGSGSVASNPNSSSGSYAAGTGVQLTASPAQGCSFLNWAGDLAGSENPQSVILSVARTVTANFQCSASPSPVPPTSGFLSGYALSNPSLRNNFSGWVGMKITVGSNALNISSLGRVCVDGNSETHVVKLLNAANGADLAGGSATLNLAGCTLGQFQYGLLPAPVTLAAGASYFVVSQETEGGDRWYDIGAVSSLADASVSSAVYSNGATWSVTGGTNTSYVPIDFQYNVAPPDPNPPLIVAFSAATLRRDFSGWVGTMFTVRANSRTVNFLGRLCIAGNIANHNIKLVQMNGVDVPGGTIAVNMSGCTPGQFVYSALAGPINLQAGTSYYLVSQETSGGDQWYDLTSIVMGAGATSNSAVYSSGTAWVTISSSDKSYVPPNLK